MAALMIGCGGDGGDGDTSPTAADPCNIPPVEWRTITWEGADGGLTLTLSTLTRGVIRAAADWDKPANNVDLYLTDASCQLLPPIAPGPPPCQTIYASAEGSSNKPELLEACVNAGTYQVMLVDRGLTRNKVVITIEAAAGTP